jgi:hypothetical protein
VALQEGERESAQPWPPTDTDPPHQPPRRVCEPTQPKYAAPSDAASRTREVRGITTARLQQRSDWYAPSCARWKLGGEWRLRPERKIFLATMVSSISPPIQSGLQLGPIRATWLIEAAN